MDFITGAFWVGFIIGGVYFTGFVVRQILHLLDADPYRYEGIWHIGGNLVMGIASVVMYYTIYALGWVINNFS